MEVLEKLLEREPREVSEIHEALAVEPTLLSHHLRILRESGLIIATRKGKNAEYRLAPGVRSRDGRGVDLECCVLKFRDAEPDSTAQDESAPDSNVRHA